MVEQAISWGIGIIMMVDISYILYFNVLQVVAKIKCKKKRPLHVCHESGCRYATYCENYEHVCTEEEMASLRKLIEDIRRKKQ